MSCSFVRENLHDFVSGELNSSDAERIENHLQSCESCRACVSNMHGFRSRVRSLLKMTAPQELRDSILMKTSE